MKKNNYLFATIMLFLIGICCIPTNSYAAICDSIGHSYSTATCTSLATCIRCNGTKGGYASHSYGNWVTSTSATCTSDGSKYRKCSNCSDTDWGTISALGHTGGSLSDNYNASQHWKTCTRCGGGYDHASHRGGNWYPDGASHYKDCDTCDKKKYTSGAHDKNQKVDIPGDDKQHDMFCQSCWDSGYRTKGGDEYQGKENHPGWSEGETSPHKCTACKHVMEGNTPSKWMQYHNYDGLTSGYITQPWFSCATCGENLTILNGTYPSLHATGLPESKYVASDASIGMDPVPTLPHGTYTLYWTNGDSDSPRLNDINGNSVTPQIDPADVALHSWGRKNLKTHAQKTKDYAKATYDAQIELYGIAFTDNCLIGSTEEDLYAVYDMIDSDINRASANEKLQWNGVLYDACKNVYRDGTTYEPVITNSGTRYELTYNHPAGGWLIPPNMYNGSPSLLDSLFQYGGYQSESPVAWTANIYYCYRVYGRDTVPKNGYQALYLYDTVTVYNSGPIDVTVSIPADMKLIDKTGYRYYGVATQVSSVGNIRPATSSASISRASTGTVTVGWDASRSAAIVTFFVEPVLLSWGQKAINYNGDIMDLIAHSHQGSGLEFPDYYDSSEGRCYIPVSTVYDPNVIEPLESLHKYYWPGFILRKSEVWKEGTTTVLRK